MARSLNDLSKSALQSPTSLNDLSMIVQWSPWSPQSPQSFDKVQKNLSMIVNGSDLSMNAQQTLKEHSRSTQGSHRSPNDLSAIFQWTPNLSTLNSFFVAFVRSGQSLIAQWSSSCVKGPLLHTVRKRTETHTRSQLTLVRPSPYLNRWDSRPRRPSNKFPISILLILEIVIHPPISLIWFWVLGSFLAWINESWLYTNIHI